MSYRIKLNAILALLVIYFWVTEVFFYTNTLNRFLYIVPSVLLSGIIAYLLSARRDQRLKKSSYLLLLFLFGSVFTGIYNSEIEIIGKTTMFVMPLLAANEKLFTIKTSLVNKLFLITIGIGIISFHMGYNEYGYLPGHSLLNGLTPWWRISIFPASSPTVSAFFALFVYVYNLQNKSKSAKYFRITSIYFLLLSGNRTSILIFLFVLLYQLLTSKSKFSNLLPHRLSYFLPYICLTIPIIVLSTNIIFQISSSQIGEEYVLRGHQYESREEVSDYVRFILWENLLSLFWESPIFGLGSYNFYDYFPYAPSHSESKWLSLLASNGIFSIILFFFLVIKYYKSVKKDESYSTLGILIMIVAMFYYGSFYNPYHIFYFLNIALLGNDK